MITISKACYIHFSSYDIDVFTTMNILTNLRQTVCRNLSSDSKITFNHLISALDSYEDIKLSPLQLTRCIFGKTSTSPHITYNDYFITQDIEFKGAVPQVKFRTLFQNGFDLLQQLISGKFAAKDKKSTDFIYAIHPLLSFLNNKDKHEHALRRKDAVDILDNKEGAVAALLTNHLLSDLVPGHEYIISTDYEDKPKYCPCLSACQKEIVYGRTIIGSKALWYKVPDVVLWPTSVMVQPLKEEKQKRRNDIEDEDEDDMSYLCDIEQHNTALALEEKTSQMISQTIAWSLYTSKLRNRGPELPDISLIPSLIITPTTYGIYMYDYKHDVLIGTEFDSESLWDEPGYKFNTSAILNIWMVLNYTTCLPALFPAQLKYFSNSSNFQNLCASSGLKVDELTSNLVFQTDFERSHQGQKTRELFDCN